MDLDQAIQDRRSIRGFTAEPVSRDLLEEIIAPANRAPSSMNTQPWHLHVLTGAPLEQLRRGNSERMLGGVPPSREIEDYAAYEGEHRKRRIEIAVQLFEAPVPIVVCFDKALLNNTIAHFDIGTRFLGFDA